MRKLALDREILLKIEKPARYLGNEINSVHKELSDGMVRFCMCFPDVYEVGMSHLGLPIIYTMLNSRKDIWCERVYSPWVDLDKIMRERNIPLFALESQDPIRNFDFLGITIQYEMCYTNILQVLDLSGIPLQSSGRGEDDPIVIGGGPCTYNPEPIAEFFDLFYMGEGEISMLPLIDLYKENRAAGGRRSDFLKKAAGVPGIYVPSLYDIAYNDDGTIREMIPLCKQAPRTVKRVIVNDLDGTYYPVKPMIPFIRPVQERVVMEIQRGCIRGCRFCQAGMVYRPNRERSRQYCTKTALAMLDETGQDELCLSSLSSSDYSDILPLINELIEECGRRKINISLPSLRIDAASLDILKKVQDIRKSSVTFAPEAGSQRLRDVINKGLTDEQIINGASTAFKAGWNKVKLYFMLGQPTETREDRLAVADLAEKIAERYYEDISKQERISRGMGKVQINASSSFFVPKPFTPFQWAVMLHEDEYTERAYEVKDAFKKKHNHKSLSYQYNDADITVLEGLFARGDRRVAGAILYAYRHGANYDAWSEYFKKDIWNEAFDTCGLDPDFYNVRARSLDEILPWDFIDIGVSKEFLMREWNRAINAVTSPNCRDHCNGCGASVFGGGICYEV